MSVGRWGGVCVCVGGGGGCQPSHTGQAGHGCGDKGVTVLQKDSRMDIGQDTHVCCMCVCVCAHACSAGMALPFVPRPLVTLLTPSTT